MARKAQTKQFYSNNGLVREMTVKDFIKNRGIKDNNRKKLYTEEGAIDTDGVMWRIDNIPVPSKTLLSWEGQYQFNDLEQTLCILHINPSLEPLERHQMFRGMFNSWAKAHFIMDTQRMTNIHEVLSGDAEFIELNESFTYKFSVGGKRSTIHLQDEWFLDRLLHRMECAAEGRVPDDLPFWRANKQYGDFRANKY